MGSFSRDELESNRSVSSRFSQVVRAGFTEEVMFWQKWNDEQEPALERGGEEGGAVSTEALR